MLLVYFLVFFIKTLDFYHVYDGDTDTLTVYYGEDSKCGYKSQGSKVIQAGNLLKAPTTTSTTTTTTTTTTKPSTTTTQDRTKFNCIDNWTKVKRDGYNWCWQIFWFNETHDSAQSVCLGIQSANLSGFQNVAEKTTVANAFSSKFSNAISGLNTRTTYYGMLWIGLQRTSQCWNKNTTECKTGSAFKWTDGSTSLSTASLTTDWWTPNNPDNSGNVQTYVVMYMSSNASDKHSGKLDDATNDFNANSMFTLRGYICGKPATA
ncbi:unnamed protein product [Caenorhabditis angaria]|uniref:C-type lectin domain-containing protein n=1 Tax=Caenorhabditis angaria TaxID=860376 RepID=A0A9P1ILL0_9PELO|nr:unnamed protein product [Caenorhabditis angaria]